jgi:hypothetical protein
VSQPTAVREHLLADVLRREQAITRIDSRTVIRTSTDTQESIGRANSDDNPGDDAEGIQHTAAPNKIKEVLAQKLGGNRRIFTGRRKSSSSLLSRKPSNSDDILSDETAPTSGDSTSTSPSTLTANPLTRARSAATPSQATRRQ